MKKVIYIFLFCCISFNALADKLTLDKKVEWSVVAFNHALMSFCMPQLDDDEEFDFWVTASGYGEEETKKNGLGEIEYLHYNKNTLLISSTKKATLMPKCSSFVSLYKQQYEKSKKISLKQIIDMCLQTIEDNLVCENIVLTMIDISNRNTDENKQYDLNKMQKKIESVIKANHQICSEDNRFCTTYNLFSESSEAFFEFKEDGFENDDAIFEQNTGKIIGYCRGVSTTEGSGGTKFLQYYQLESRCRPVDSKYKLFSFTIQDLSNDNKIRLVYTNWEDYFDIFKKRLKTTEELIADVNNTTSTIKVSTDTNRALNSEYISLGLDLCEKDNQSRQSEMLCYTKILNKYLDELKKWANTYNPQNEKNWRTFKETITDKFLTLRIVFNYGDKVLNLYSPESDSD